MKIGIDISQIAYKGTGVGRFTEGLVNTICNYDSKNDWVFFFSSLRQSLDSSIRHSIQKKQFKLVEMKIPPRGLSFLWNDIHALKIETITGPLDWFITSDWTEPPARCKKATIIHDLVFVRYPDTVDPLIRKVQKTRMEWIHKESSLIFCDSISTQQDVNKYFYDEKKRIVVNYPGVEVSFPNKTVLDNVRAKFKLKQPFVLTVGKLEPRKNLQTLINAYNQIEGKKPQLLIVGPDGWGPELRPVEGVRLLGYLSDEELHTLYLICLFFIYPSLWEGFGYPVVEAMNLGVPVATSNTSSLKEIGKNAALLFNPGSQQEIKNALERLMQDDKFRRELSRKGKARAKDFTWKRYYDILVQSLNNFNSRF